MMAYGKRYSQDPYWITARFASDCGNGKTCGARINKGDAAYYYPSSKTAVCESCGRKGEADLQDEMINEAHHVW